MLQVLPAEIGQLIRLQHLDLSSNKNKLEIFPAELGQLSCLKGLDLSYIGYKDDELKELSYQLYHLTIYTKQASYSRGIRFEGSNDGRI